MDWKDHLLAVNDCHGMARQFIPFAAESFLVTLANKGLYKRALKDLEGITGIEIKGVEDGLQLAFEEVTITLRPNVAESSCSCPSKTICKHVLMGILAAAEYANTTREENTNLPIPWSALMEVDITQLRKKAGKKLFEDTLRLIQEGWTADFQKGEMLEATINTEQVTVYFPQQDSIEHAVCKCGDKGLCKHKLIAILSYLSEQGKLETDGNEDVTFSFLSEETKKLLGSVNDFIIQIFDKGIISCGETDAETAIQFSIRLEAAGIGNLARLLRSLSADLENMLVKNIGFNQITTFSTLSRLHNTIHLILCNAQNNSLLSRLIENARSDYYTTPIGTFTGLGAIPWQTRSGYFGTTVYFFYHEKQTICTYSVALADYYSQTEELATLDNLIQQAQRNNHWGEHSLTALSQSEFTLRNFKLNRQNRLSSSLQTQCEITDNVTRLSYVALTGNVSLFDIPSNHSHYYDYFDKRQPDEMVVIPFELIGNMYFDPMSQKLYFTLFGEQEETVVTCEIDYNPFTMMAIKYMETRGRHLKSASRYMTCLKRPGYLTPVSLIDEKGMINFYLSLK